MSLENTIIVYPLLGFFTYMVLKYGYDVEEKYRKGAFWFASVFPVFAIGVFDWWGLLAILIYLGMVYSFEKVIKPRLGSGFTARSRSRKN